MFIDQATHNGTRPNSPVGDEPATTPSGPLRYGSTPWMGPTPEDLSVTGFVRWPSVSLVKRIVGWVISSAGGIAFQSLALGRHVICAKVNDLVLPGGRILFADTLQVIDKDLQVLKETRTETVTGAVQP